MVGSDKERPKGRVGSGSDNARGSPILTHKNKNLLNLANDEQIYINDRQLNRIGINVSLGDS